MSRASIPWLAASLVLTSPLRAQQQLWNVDGVYHAERFGESLALLPDLDGDGVRDLLVGATEGIAVFDYAAARVLSGATLATLREVRGAALEYFGYAVADGGDLDGDGTSDLLVGAPQVSAARAYSGRDGSLLHEWRGDGTQDWFGSAVAGMGDLDGDGVGDVAIGAATRHVGAAQLGAIEFWSGASGTRLWQFTGAIDGSWFGDRGRLANLGDLDLDGVADLGALDVVGGTTPGSVVRACSGRTQAELFAVPFAQGNRQGYTLTSIAPIGDFDGDGRPDLLVGGWDSMLFQPARMWVLSGFDGSELQVVDSPVVGFSFAVDSAGDRDGDGKAELMLSVRNAFGTPINSVTLHRGSDGALLGRIDRPYQNSILTLVGGLDVDGDGAGDVTLGDTSATDAGLPLGFVGHFAWPAGNEVASRLGEGDALTLLGGAALLDDLDGDGAPDVAAVNGTTIQRSSVRLFSGRDGALLADHRVGGFPNGALVALPDLDGDGHDDLAVALDFGAANNRVELRSSGDGRVLRTFVPSGPSGGFGSVMAVGIQPGGAVHLAIATPDSSAGVIGGGEVAVYDATSGALLFRRLGTWSREALGSSVAFLGDVDGDAIGDWAFGAPRHGGGGRYAGRVVVASGKAGAVIASRWGASAGDQFGTAVAALRDLDGDAIAELVVAAPYAGSNSEGEVTVLAGGAWTPIASVVGAAIGDLLGFGLVTLRDLDGDGADEWAAFALAPNRVEVRSGDDGDLLARFPLALYDFRQRLVTAAPWQTGSPSGDAIDDLFVVDPATPMSSAWLLALDDLLLQVDPPSAKSGATVTASLRGGPTGAMNGLLLADVNGVPFNQWLAFGLYDAAGATVVSDVVPPGLSGLSWTLVGWGIGHDGRLKDSTPQTLTFE
jgi:hypothetical protein